MTKPVAGGAGLVMTDDRRSGRARTVTPLPDALVRNTQLMEVGRCAGYHRRPTAELSDCESGENDQGSVDSNGSARTTRG